MRGPARFLGPSMGLGGRPRTPLHGRISRRFPPRCDPLAAAPSLDRTAPQAKKPSSFMAEHRRRSYKSAAEPVRPLLAAPRDASGCQRSSARSLQPYGPVFRAFSSDCALGTPEHVLSNPSGTPAPAGQVPANCPGMLCLNRDAGRVVWYHGEASGKK